MNLPDELDLEGGDASDEEKPDDGKRRRGGGRPTRPASEADLRKRIEDGLNEVVEFVERRLEWPDIAASIREDSKRMAEVLAARATRHQRLARGLARVFGKDSLLAFARAFGPTLRAIADHLRDWRDTRAAEQDALEQKEAPATNEYGQPLG